MSYEGAFLDHGELLLYYTDCTSPFHISFWDIDNLDLAGGKSEKKGVEFRGVLQKAHTLKWGTVRLRKSDLGWKSASKIVTNS